jgi:hypothetical protein
LRGRYEEAQKQVTCARNLPELCDSAYSNQPNFPTGGSTTAVFAGITPAAAAIGPNFSLTLSAQSATVTPGGTSNLTITAGGRRLQRANFAYLLCAGWSDLCSEPVNDLTWV